MGATERDLMERDRDFAAMGELDARQMRALATRALLRAYGEAPVNAERAWEFAQFAADMLRASLPPKESL